MREECFQALGVLGAGARGRSLLEADDHRGVQPGAVDKPDVGGLVDELVECDEQEVAPHDLDDRLHALHRRAHRGAEYRALRDRGVEDAGRTEVPLQAARHPEDPAGLPDILAVEHDLRAAGQLVPQRPVDGTLVGELGRLGITRTATRRPGPAASSGSATTCAAAVSAAGSSMARTAEVTASICWPTSASMAPSTDASSSSALRSSASCRRSRASGSPCLASSASSRGR